VFSLKKRLPNGKHTLNAVFFRFTYDRGIAVPKLGFAAFAPEAVRGVGMETLNFSGSSQLETFFRAGVRFHFWHKSLV